MFPFLEDALSDAMRMLMQMIVSSYVLEGVPEGTSYELIKLDLSVAENLLHYELLKLPTATKSLLKTKAIPVDKKISFMNNCKQILVNLLEKLQERCPLNYLIRCNASSSVAEFLSFQIFRKFFFRKRNARGNKSAFGLTASSLEMTNYQEISSETFNIMFGTPEAFIANKIWR